MFVCRVPKISHVKMKRRISVEVLSGRRARERTGGREGDTRGVRVFPLLPSACHAGYNGRWATTQLGGFTLRHNSRRAKQPGLVQAPGVARIFQGQWRTMLNQSKVNFTERVLVTDFSRPSVIFWRMNDGRPKANSSRPYEDSAKRWKLHEDK